MVQILTINVQKGGVGKTTLQYNFTDWLASQGKKILVIDSDYSCNATSSYRKLVNQTNNTIINIFRNKSVDILKVNENIDLISGDSEIEQINTELITKQNNCLLLYMWIADHYESLEKYDYIVIDTHNDQSLVTKNCLAVADVILGVSDPSSNGFTALLNLENDVENLRKELIDVRTRESHVTGEVFFIANNVQHNVTNHREFVNEVKKSSNYLGVIQRKALLGKSLLEMQSIVEQEKNLRIARQHKLFYEATYKVFENIKKQLDKGEIK